MREGAAHVADDAEVGVRTRLICVRCSVIDVGAPGVLHTGTYCLMRCRDAMPRLLRR